MDFSRKSAERSMKSCRYSLAEEWLTSFQPPSLEAEVWPSVSNQRRLEVNYFGDEFGALRKLFEINSKAAKLA